jgi:hypothetical protein
MYRSISWLRDKLVVSGKLHAPAALPLGKEPRYPLDRRLGGPQSQYGRCWQDKFLDPAGTRTLTPLSSIPYSALYRIRYPGYPLAICSSEYYHICLDHKENSVCNNSYIAACASVAARKCWQCSCNWDRENGDMIINLHGKGLNWLSTGTTNFTYSHICVALRSFTG